MDFLPLAAMSLLVFKMVDFVRYLRAGDSNGWVTQLFAWAAGVIAVLLYAKSGFGVSVGGFNLGHLNIWAQIVVGLNIGSAGSAWNDARKTFDVHNSAVVPTLLPTRNNPATKG